MSRGLGAMQRKILLNLTPSKEWANASRDSLYRGHGYMFATPNLVTSQGERTRLGDGVFDLSATQMFLASKIGKRRLNQMNGKMLVDEEWSASFWRAARRLRKRGLLLPCRPAAKQKRLVYLSEVGKREVNRLSDVITTTTLNAVGSPDKLSLLVVDPCQALGNGGKSSPGVEGRNAGDD